MEGHLEKKMEYISEDEPRQLLETELMRKGNKELVWCVRKSTTAD